ncbi:MAG: GHKL domain-containing protein [Clostridia bacterium]|nr:GHKL domain-containing protein [Clostridia bacterium]
MPKIGALDIISSVANMITVLGLMVFTLLIFNLKLNIKNAVLSSIAVGFICSSAVYLLKFLSEALNFKNIHNIKTFIGVLIFVFTLRIYYKISYSKSIISTCLFTILSALATITAFIILDLLGYKDILGENIQVNIFANLIITVFYIIMFIIIRSFKVFSNFPKEVRNKAYISNMIYISFTLVIIGANMSYYYYNSQGNPNVKNTGIIFNAVLVLAYLVYSIINTNTFFKLELKDQELQYQIFYNKTLDMLMSDLSRFKHNYNNMLNVAYAYIKMKKWDELSKYFNELVEETNKSNSFSKMIMLNIKNAGVLGLITSKIDYATQNGINMKIFIDDEIKEINMKISELCEVLGILIDNAIEAAGQSTEKLVTLYISNINNIVTFCIENSVNEKVDTNTVFDKGFSTKGENRGLGLWLLKKIIQKYDNVLLNTFSEPSRFKQELIVS